MIKRFTLAACRVNAGYSQKSAAALIGVSNKTLNAWENGKAFPTQPYIEKMCVLYNVPYDLIQFAVD